MHFNQIKISLLLGAVLTAPALIFPANNPPAQTAQIGRAELQQLLMMLIPSGASPLREASQKTMVESHKNSLLEQKLPEATIAHQAATYHTRIQTIGTLITSTEQPKRLYNFLAPEVYKIQQRLASTGMGAEAIINVLEHPEEQAAITVLVDLFQKHPEKIATYRDFIVKLESACKTFFTPQSAMALQFAVDNRKQALAALSDETLSIKNIDTKLLNRQKNYNSFSKRFCEGPKAICRKVAPLVRLALTPCANVGAQALGWTAAHPYLTPVVTPLIASLTYQSLSATFACFFGQHFFAPDNTREALLAATKLAPLLYPFGLPRDINEKAPLTIENAHLVLRRFRVAGYMDVAINIVTLINAGHAIPCAVSAPSQTTLQQGLEQLWQATNNIIPSCSCRPIAPHTFGVCKNQQIEQEAFDLFILNTITTQTFNIAFNFTDCPLSQITLPKLHDMQFIATRCYHGVKAEESMHTMMVQI